jgi:anti-anti-sigma factor
VTVLRPVGPLTQADADQFKARLIEVATQTLGRVVIDASRVPYVDSHGLESLVEMSEAMGESGRVLKICALGETLREVFDLTGWGDAFEYYRDPISGVRSFL